MAAISNQLSMDLSKIVPSKTNPRKYFDATYISELAASIKSVGLISPLLVRPLNGSGTFEIVAGECRYKAAKEAGLKEVPVIARKIDDVQAMELQIIENLQRQDVHPMEEGNGYKALLAMKRTGPSPADKGSPLYTIDQVAAKVGKSVSYVYQRLKLADLSADWQKEFMANPGRFTAGHAILVARLSATHQAELLKDCWKPDYDKNYPSVRDLQRIIEEQIIRNLDKAPFKSTDVLGGLTLAEAKAVNPASLEVPGTDPLRGNKPMTQGQLPLCTTCPFRSGNEPGCAKNAQNICLNEACYEKKVTLHLARQQERLKEKHPNLVTVSRSYDIPSEKRSDLPNVIPAKAFQEVKPNAKGATPALVVDGRDRGSVVYIAPSKQEQARAASAGVDLKQRRENLEQDIAKAARVLVLEAVAKAFKVDDTTLLDLAAFVVHHGLDSNGRKRLLGDAYESMYGEDSFRTVLKKLPKADILRTLALSLYGQLAIGSWSRNDEDLARIAKHHNVDTKALGKKARALPEFAKREENLKALEAAKAAKAPKSKTTKAKAKVARASAARRSPVRKSAPVKRR